ncbi:MAG: hypothetical protein ACLT5P_07120 [Flavonifractor plautii]
MKRFLPLIAEAAGRFRRKLRIDVFQLEVTAAAPARRRRPVLRRGECIYRYDLAAGGAEF